MPYGSPVRDKKWIVDGTGTTGGADAVHLGTAPAGLAGGAAPFEVLACVRVGDASIRRIDMSSPFGYDLWLPTGTQPSMALQERRRLAAFRSVACGLPVVLLVSVRAVAQLASSGQLNLDPALVAECTRLHNVGESDRRWRHHYVSCGGFFVVGVTLTEELASVTLSRLPLPLPPVVRDGLCALGLPQTRPGLWGTVDAGEAGRQVA